jgi:hypothetical protein
VQIDSSLLPFQNAQTDQTMSQDQQQYGGYDSTGYAPEAAYNNSNGGYDATGYAPEASYNNTNGGYDATGYAPEMSYSNYNGGY